MYYESWEYILLKVGVRVITAYSYHHLNLVKECLIIDITCAFLVIFCDLSFSINNRFQWILLSDNRM